MPNTTSNGQSYVNTQPLPSPKKTWDAVVYHETINALKQLSPQMLQDPAYVTGEILHQVNEAIQLENGLMSGKKWPTLQHLLPIQIAEIFIRTCNICRLAGADLSVSQDQDMIAIYQDEGTDKGLYVSSEVSLRILARQYYHSISMKDVAELTAILQEKLPRLSVCKLPHLVAVNNGIFDYDTKQLLEFSPDRVFLSKSRVNYNPNATNVVLHNDDDGTDWDVESWLADLSDNPELTQLFWEILGAIVRPLVAWDKSAWFYSESGNNGKGTLCELMKQLTGEGSYASISLADFNKDFMLEPLLRATAIIVDENDVGTFIDKAANLKAVITGDTISINRKFKNPIAYQFRGFMVQCLNEMPRIKDKSDSFFRRQIFVPFTKCFTGRERKYIKHDYLHRKEVLEYVLHKVLHMDYYSLSVPDVCKTALEEYKTFVDPVRAFLAEIMPIVKWDLLPNSFLYELYKEWYKKNIGLDRNLKSSAAFTKDIKVLIESDYPMWTHTTQPKRPGRRMDDAEPLIMEYQVKGWMNTRYLNSNDITKICRPTTLAPHYRGIYRLVEQVGSDEDLLCNNPDD